MIVTTPDSRFPPTALSLWRARIGLSQSGAAEALGVAMKTYQMWERGFTFETNEPVIYQRRVMLAAAALEHGLGSQAIRREQPDLAAWRGRMGMNHEEAAEVLGVSRKRYQEWEIGRDYTTKVSITKIDRRTWLACAAAEYGIAEISLVDAKPAVDPNTGARPQQPPAAAPITVPVKPAPTRSVPRKQAPPRPATPVAAPAAPPARAMTVGWQEESADDAVDDDELEVIALDDLGYALY